VLRDSTLNPGGDYSDCGGLNENWAPTPGFTPVAQVQDAYSFRDGIGPGHEEMTMLDVLGGRGLPWADPAGQSIIVPAPPTSTRFSGKTM